jgi:hypothetical protein
VLSLRRYDAYIHIYVYSHICIYTYICIFTHMHIHSFWGSTSPWCPNWPPGCKDPPGSASQVDETIGMCHHTLFSHAYWKVTSVDQCSLAIPFLGFQELAWESSNKLSLITSYFSKCGASLSHYPTSLHMSFDYTINQIHFQRMKIYTKELCC